jgi:hypothetical protein
MYFIQGENEERVLNAFQTRYWRKILKVIWTDKITNEEERLLLKILIL